jgi:hypothetical protein
VVERLFKDKESRDELAETWGCNKELSIESSVLFSVLDLD